MTKREERIKRLNTCIRVNYDMYVKYCKEHGLSASEIVRFGKNQEPNPNTNKLVTYEKGGVNVHAENIVKLVDKLFMFHRKRMDAKIASLLVRMIVLNTAPKTIDDKTIYDYIYLSDDVDNTVIKPMMVEEIFKYLNEETLEVRKGSITSLVFDIFENYIMLINGLTEEVIKISPIQQMRLLLFK